MSRHLVRPALAAVVLSVAYAAAAAADEPPPSPPTVVIEVQGANPTNSSSPSFALSFSEIVSGPAEEHLSIEGSAVGCSIAEPIGEGASWQVALAGCGEGTIRLVLAAHAVATDDGRTGPLEPVASPVVTIDLSKPSVTQFAALTSSPVTGTSIDYTLDFAEPVSGLAGSDFTITGTSSGWSVGPVSGSQASHAIKLTATRPSAGTLVLRFSANSVRDAAGNDGPAAAVTAPAVTIQVAVPSATLVINSGAASTSNPTLSLALTAKNFGTNLRVRFSFDGGKSWTAPVAFAAAIELPLPVKQPWGGLTVRGEFRDAADAVAIASDSINYLQTQHSTMALQPRYLIRASLDYASGRVTATQAVSVTNDSGQPIGYLDFSVLARHYGELSVGSVRVDGTAAAISYPNSANLRVALGFNLRRNESAEIVITFTAQASSAIGDMLKAAFSKANGLMQLSNWHPVLSNGHGLRHPGDSQFAVAADYRLELNHPASVRIAAPGKLVASSATTKVYTLPHAREFAFAVSAGFASSSAMSSNGVRVTVFYLPGTSGAGTALSTAVKSIERFSAALGPYPYSTFVIAQGARPWVATEFSGIIFVGGANLGYGPLVAHEVAHQWWYGIVGNDQLGEAWLDESFADFTQRHFFGRRMPTYCSSLAVNTPVTAWPNSPSGNACNSYRATIYDKGTAFLEGIRARMGTTQFRAALRAIVSENRYKVVTTDIVRNAFRRFAPNRAALDTYMSAFLR